MEGLLVTCALPDFGLSKLQKKNYSFFIEIRNNNLHFHSLLRKKNAKNCLLHVVPGKINQLILRWFSLQWIFQIAAEKKYAFQGCLYSDAEPGFYWGREVSTPISCFKTVSIWPMIWPEVNSRTQRSRPRPMTPKKSEAMAKERLFEDRPSRGQRQKWSRPRTQDTIFLNYSR